MMSSRCLIALAALVGSSAALADAGCTDPVNQWQPRESLRQEVEQRGWMVQRIKVDDGCYEVRGTDRNGNKVKAKYSPASLKIRSLDIEFRPDADPSEYLGPVRQENDRRDDMRARKGHAR